jgi:hypothetical protein
MKSQFLSLLLVIGLAGNCFSQTGDEPLKKKNVSDTVLLQTRSLLVPLPFNPQKVLLSLFPGEYYNLSKANYKNELINWECKSCKPKSYPDVNEDAVAPFPFARGVATRVINVMDFKDSKGVPYKIMSFNHSEYDEDGTQTSRFTGGLLGLAKFTLTEKGWKLVFLQPAIAAYGAFSSCPAPKPVMIGEDQYAFMIKHSNGGGGGPFDGNLYLIGGAGGRYQELMAAYGIERTKMAEQDGLCAWDAEYTVPVSEKKFFRDIVITVKGDYKRTDKEGMPDEIKKLVKAGKSGNFTLVRRYVYKAGKGYELEKPVKAMLN